MNNLETKVVIKKTVLHGVGDGVSLQRVATVYIDRREYRVYAPSDAEGEAVDWVPHLTIRQLSDFNSEIEIHDAFGVLALKVVKEELEKRKLDSNTGAAAPTDREPSKEEREKPKRNSNRGPGLPTEGEPGGRGISGLINILNQSIKQVPANKYAFGVVGVVAAAALSIILVGGKWQAAVAGGVAMLAGMVVLRAFAAGQSPQAGQSLPNQALTWFVIIAFAVVLSLFIGKLYVTLFHPGEPSGSKAATDRGTQGPSPFSTATIPPGRLLRARPFHVRLDDCSLASCNVEFVLRGYDPKGRLRYDASQRFDKWTTGQVKDTDFNTADQVYFEASEEIVFQVFCRLGTGPRVVGDEGSLHWQASYEATEGYGVWLSCGGNDFKASVDIGVNLASKRLSEPPAKDDPGPPWKADSTGEGRTNLVQTCISGKWVETIAKNGSTEQHDWTFNVEANGHLKTTRTDHHVYGDYTFQIKGREWEGTLTFSDKKNLPKARLKLVDESKCDKITTDDDHIHFERK